MCHLAKKQPRLVSAKDRCLAHGSAGQSLGWSPPHARRFDFWFDDACCGANPVGESSRVGDLPERAVPNVSAKSFRVTGIRISREREWNLIVRLNVGIAGADAGHDLDHLVRPISARAASRSAPRQGLQRTWMTDRRTCLLSFCDKL
jgi:hypothetical protein